MVDEGVADDEDSRSGTRIGVAAIGPAEQFEIVGIAKYGDAQLARQRDVRDLRRPDRAALLDKEDSSTRSRPPPRTASRPRSSRSRIEAELGADVTVRTGVEQADEDSGEIATFTTIIRYFLLSFAGVALFVGAFVIFNTLSITVAQRTREFATLRTIGASRRQILISVILEALVIGFIASVIGLFAGLGLAVGLNELFTALNLDLPQTETVFATRTIVVSLLVGTLVTLAAGLFPALRATRVPPIAAVREGATLPRGRFARFTPYIAGAIVVLAVLALSYGTLADDMAHRRPVRAPRHRRAGALHRRRDALVAAGQAAREGRRDPGAPARRRRREARRGQRAAQSRPDGGDRGRADDRDRARHLRRRARAGAAGLEQRRDRAADPVRPDHHLAGRLLGVPGRGRRCGRGARGVETVSNVRQDIAEIDGDGGNLTGLDEQINDVYDFRWEEGSDELLAELGDDGAVLPNNVAEDNDLARRRHDRGALDRRQDEGVRRPRHLRGQPVLPAARLARASRSEAFDELYERPRNRFTLVNVAGRPGRGGQGERRGGRSRASPTRAVQTRRSGSRRRTRRSGSSCCCSTSCSRSRWSSASSAW